MLVRACRVRNASASAFVDVVPRLLSHLYSLVDSHISNEPTNNLGNKSKERADQGFPALEPSKRKQPDGVANVLPSVGVANILPSVPSFSFTSVPVRTVLFSELVNDVPCT